MNLTSKEGYKIGYSPGAEFTPLDYMYRSNPKKVEMPKGFRKMLYTHCGRAWLALCNGKTVCGFKFRDIIEF